MRASKSGFPFSLLCSRHHGGFLYLICFKLPLPVHGSSILLERYRTFQRLCPLDATQPDPSSFLPLLSQSINEPIGNDTNSNASHDAGSRHLNWYVRSLLPVPDRSTRRDLLTPLIASLLQVSATLHSTCYLLYQSVERFFLLDRR